MGRVEHEGFAYVSLDENDVLDKTEENPWRKRERLGACLVGFTVMIGMFVAVCFVAFGDEVWDYHPES